MMPRPFLWLMVPPIKTRKATNNEHIRTFLSLFVPFVYFVVKKIKPA